eukprot:1136955-Pelagomonas_calceolata.AAC.2
MHDQVAVHSATWPPSGVVLSFGHVVSFMSHLVLWACLAERQCVRSLGLLHESSGAMGMPDQAAVHLATCHPSRVTLWCRHIYVKGSIYVYGSSASGCVYHVRLLGLE